MVTARSASALSVVVALVFLVSASRAAAAPPVELREVGAFSSPVEAVSPLHEDHLLFVVERSGRVRVVNDGVVVAQPFLDVSSLVSTDGEGGLLSIAFPPRYWQTGRFVIVYVDVAGSIQVAEYRRSASNPLLADPLSARSILTIAHPTFTNHYGGSSVFGPDGLLYLGTGDGGGAGDPDGNAQNLGALLGKLLRIDPFGADPYAIPAGNPFVGMAGVRPEIFDYGLRNPWRFSFDRATGDLVIGDVGQNRVEEVDLVGSPVVGGLNFGWNVFEGSLTFGTGTAPGAVFPVFEYQHSATACSITGGVVVRDPTLSLFGRYVYADYCGTELHSLALARPVTTDDVATGLNVSSVVSFGEDAGGCVYVVSLAGTVYRLAAAGAPVPVPCADVAPETTITSSPASPVASSATFAFSSSEAGSSFECQLDDGAWAACSSPLSYTPSPGSHSFGVRATDPGGTVDPSPAQVPFSVQGGGEGDAPPPPVATRRARASVSARHCSEPRRFASSDAESGSRTRTSRR